MFCYCENEQGKKCDGNHEQCALVKNINDVSLHFNEFKTEEEIEMVREVLCLVTSWDENPYFIVLERVERGMVNAFDYKLLENTKILKWAYLPYNRFW